MEHLYIKTKPKRANSYLIILYNKDISLISIADITYLSSMNPDEYDRELTCDMCENVFTEMSSLESHIATQHLKQFSFISSEASNV